MDFTKNNPALAPLFTVRFPEDNFVLLNKKLHRELRMEASILYKALFGTEMDMEDFTLLLKCKDGELQRIYGPSVGKDPDSNALAIKWGNKYVVLDAGLKGPKLDKDQNWDNFGLAMANFGYKDDEIALSVMLEAEDGFYNVNLPLRFQDAKSAPDLAGLKTLMKKDPETAYTLFYEVYEGVPTGGGGSGINKLQDLPEGTVLPLQGSELYEFTTKKGEEMSRILLIDKEGTKYWSPDNVGFVVGLMNEPVIEIVKLAKGKKSQYIAHGKIYDDNYYLEFGSEIKASKEKELPAGNYRIFGVNSFQGRNTSFVSYVYTGIPVKYQVDAEGEYVLNESEDRIEVLPAEGEIVNIMTCFAPSKHRVVLNSVPDINPETPAEFEILISGLEDPKKFQVSKLDAKFSLGEEAIDIDNLF